MRYLAVVIGFFLVVPFAGHTQTTKPSGKILFLTFTMKNDSSIVLKDQMVVPGTLKNRKSDNTGELMYEVTRKNKSVAARGTLQSPLVRSFDYPDPDNPAVLKGGMVVDTMTEFTIRVPDESLTAISFFKRADTGDAGLHKSVVSPEFPKGKLLGTIPLPRLKGKK